MGASVEEFFAEKFVFLEWNVSEGDSLSVEGITSACMFSPTLKPCS